MTNKIAWSAAFALGLSGFLVSCSSTKDSIGYVSPELGEYSEFCESQVKNPADMDTLERRLQAGSPTYSEEEIARALLEKASREISANATSPDRCRETLLAGTDAFQARLQSNHQLLANQGGYRTMSDPDLRAVQADVNSLWLKDQVARLTYVGLTTDDRSGAAFWAQRLATAYTVRVDAESTRLVRRLMEIYGWIDGKRFGAKVSDQAWLLVQHADDYPSLQAQAVSNMESFLASGDVKPANYAYLWDRVAVNTGQLQRYGTQPIWECTESGSLQPQPMEAPEQVDARRSMLSMGAYRPEMDRMAQSFCHTDSAQAK